MPFVGTRGRAELCGIDPQIGPDCQLIATDLCKVVRVSAARFPRSSDQLVWVRQFRAVVENLPTCLALSNVGERIASWRRCWNPGGGSAHHVRTGNVYWLRRARSRRHLLPNSPDIRSKLPIRHFDSVELKRLPNLVHSSAAVQACLNLWPGPYNPSDLGPWSGLWQRGQVRQDRVRFSRYAAAVHGWIIR